MNEKTCEHCNDGTTLPWVDYVIEGGGGYSSKCRLPGPCPYCGRLLNGCRITDDGRYAWEGMDPPPLMDAPPAEIRAWIETMLAYAPRPMTAEERARIEPSGWPGALGDDDDNDIPF